MIEISEVRRRVRQAIEDARKAAVDRRGAVVQAHRDYELFLRDIAVPVYRMTASALKAEGYAFTLMTPADAVSLVRDSSGDHVTIELDTARTSPTVMGRARFTAGRETTEIERPIREGTRILNLNEEDVLTFLLESLKPLVER